MGKCITTTSKEEWDRYIGGKENWERICIESPIDGLGFRNKLDHLILGCVASGTSLYAKGQHCGGIDQVSYSLKDEIFKVDRFAIIPDENSNTVDIVMLNKKKYKEVHHIFSEDDLLKEYPKLKTKILRQKVEKQIKR